MFHLCRGFDTECSYGCLVEDNFALAGLILVNHCGLLRYSVLPVG